MRRRLMLVVTLSFLCALEAGCGSTSSTTPKVFVPQRGGPLYRAYGYQSDSGNVEWGVARWLSYGGPSAKAIATTDVNTCARSCVGGPWVHARTTIVFSGRVPCDGVLAYARYRVTRTSNAAAAPVGETIDLSSFCGYLAFSPSLMCLSRHRRAVSVAAQRRCYAAAARSANARITRAERSLSSWFIDRVGEAAFASGELAWRAYRQRICTAAVTHEGAAPFYARFWSDVCLFHLDESHLRELAFFMTE